MTHTTEVNMAFVIDALYAHYEQVKEQWGSEASIALWDDILEMVEEIGISENISSAMEFVDNYLINGEFVSREKLSDYTGITYFSDDERDAAFELLAEDALVKNADYACLRF